MLLFYLVLPSNTHKKYDATLLSVETPSAKTAGRSLIETTSEIYAERLSQFRYQFEPQKSKSRSSTLGGLQFLTSFDGMSHRLISPHLDFEELGSWMENIKYSESLAQIDTKDLDRLFLNFMLQNNGVRKLQARLEGNFKHFFFTSGSQERAQGFEKYFILNLSGSLEKQKRICHFSKSFTRQDISLLLGDVSRDLMNQDELDKLFLTPWPAPRGKLPILWSHQTMAGWVHLLTELLHFHCQSPENFNSFITKLSPLHFQLLDNWKTDLGCDARGHKRKELLWLSAENPFLAESKKAGFFRRASFDSPAIVAPWQLALYGSTQIQRPIEVMKQGLSIREFEVLSFDKLTGLADLKVSRAYLVHDGKEGEPIESTRWRVSLFDIFSSFELFSDHLRAHPSVWEKEGQNLFLEISTPQGLSRDLEFPGTVPLTHYW